jgi:hypothetical protein
MRQFHSTFPWGLFVLGIVALVIVASWSWQAWHQWPLTMRYVMGVIAACETLLLVLLWRYRREQW